MGKVLIFGLFLCLQSNFRWRVVISFIFLALYQVGG